MFAKLVNRRPSTANATQKVCNGKLRQKCTLCVQLTYLKHPCRFKISKRRWSKLFVQDDNNCAVERAPTQFLEKKVKVNFVIGFGVLYTQIPIQCSPSEQA